MKNESIRKVINVEKHNYSPVWTFKQEDDGVLKLELFKGSIPLDLTGQTIKLGVIRANKTLVELEDQSCFKINNNELDITLKNNILSVAGIAECDLELIDKDGKMTTASFFININKKTIGSNSIQASNEISSLEKLKNDFKSDVEGMKEEYNSWKDTVLAENNVAKLQNEINGLGSQLDKKANKSDVAKISSGTPLFASSIAEMKDTTRNYVNTVDGYLYTYNGSKFISSGVKYQEKGISDGQVYSEKTSFFIENLFDKLAVEEGGYYDNLNNKINNPNYVETDYIPILQNQILMLTRDCVGINSQITKFYDINKSFLSGQNSIGDNQTPGQIDQSKHENCAYIRISLSKSSLEQYMVTSGTTIPTSIIPYGISFKKENELTKQVKENAIKIEANKNDIEQLKNDANKIIITSKWKNKKWCVVGDSITETNSTSTIKYHDIIKENIGCTVYNQGKSGTGYAVAYGGGLAIVDRVADIPSDSDLITVFAGTNDWGRNLTTLGSFSDTTKDTFYGALKLSLQAIIDKFPNKRIGVITPIPRNTYRSGNTAGEMLKQYRDAILEVCEYYSIPCLDLYKESGFYATNSTFNTTYLPDGLHPNDAGHEILAEKIEKWIETL